MPGYVLDSSALLRWVEGAAGAARVEQIISKAANGGVQAALSAVSWGEVYYVVARRTDEAEAERFSADFRKLGITIVDADYWRAERAGSFRNRFSLPYADSFAASLAAERAAKLVTADYDFKRVVSAVDVDFLPAKQ